MINLHINTHLAQTIGVEMGCPEVTRPKSFEEAMCCNDSSWLQRYTPHFIAVCATKSSKLQPFEFMHHVFCFFLNYVCVRVCVVWMFCMFIDASTRISTCGCSIFPFRRAFLGLLLFPKENPMETHLPS